MIDEQGKQVQVMGWQVIVVVRPSAKVCLPRNEQRNQNLQSGEVRMMHRRSH
jgi:hypothetical protein